MEKRVEALSVHFQAGMASGAVWENPVMVNLAPGSLLASIMSSVAPLPPNPIWTKGKSPPFLNIISSCFGRTPSLASQFHEL